MNAGDKKIYILNRGTIIPYEWRHDVLLGDLKDMFN